MYNLEKRALMGDRAAQRECTEKGIVLRCPICGESVTVTGPEDWHPTFYDPDSGGDPYAFQCECGLMFGTNCYDFKQALALWNTRSAPPSIKKQCSICEYYIKDEECCNGFCELKPGPVFEPDDYCNEFESKEH